ncbi:ABC transporter permease [Actinobacillus porcinus]|uniref:ABC transporter permease n=1 Tax=Actinobacillus porcinus TaxID=51048 RepID=UPI002354B3E0|nr:ABC transporter permease [Actinobacillus porcinus]
MKITNNHILSVTILILATLLSVFTNDFATIENIYDVVNNYAMLMILACGLFVVLLSGGIDISFPAITIISQYIMVTVIGKYDIGFLGVFIVSSTIGILLGFINALFVNRLNVPSIIITISTLNIFYGGLLYFTKGIWLYDYPEWFTQELLFFKQISQDDFEFGLSFQAVMAILSILLTWLITSKLTIGRKIYALGGNQDATSRMGFNILFLQLLAYGYMGFMAGIAGIVQSYTVQSVAPDSLLGYELTVLAAVVLGGASLSGGRGTLFGTVMGVMLLAIIQNGLNLMNVSSYWQTIITGIIIILSISATALGQIKKQGV